MRVFTSHFSHFTSLVSPCLPSYHHYDLSKPLFFLLDFSLLYPIINVTACSFFKLKKRVISRIGDVLGVTRSLSEQNHPSSRVIATKNNKKLL